MHIVSTTDLMPPSWQFLAEVDTRRRMRFSTFTTRPAPDDPAARQPGPWTRFAVARQACRAARESPDALLYSHLPRMAEATNTMRLLDARAVPLVAFAFNFTTLPGRARRAVLRQTLRGIDQFVVFSAFERGLYADTFAIPPARLVHVPWAMHRPEPGPVHPLQGQGPYLCAIGGEGRDYATLAAAAAGLPGTRVAVVARSYSLAGVTLPANVTAFIDLALPQTWALLAGAEAMILPLRDAETACGHITLVAAKLLGVPVIVTDSAGIADYVGGDRVAARIPPRDPDAMAAAILAVLGDSGARARAAAGTARAAREHDPQIWLDHVASTAALLR